ncbi:hypothetical protein [Massilia sp.]|uniref:hypothetical protein n=1 Tax=Massilia sp. TaxID=1882437 RepID=UPI00391BC9D5
MKAKTRLLAGILIGILACEARAATESNSGKPSLRTVDADTLLAWKIDAWAGDAEKQEHLAELLLDPRARVKKAERSEGVHFLLRAATSGRRKSMLQLADALDKGSFGFKKLPAAAHCWAGTPADFDTRLACLSVTDLRAPRDRVPCRDLRVLREGIPADKKNAATMARLCLANKTPAFLVPGPPPGRDADERWRLYAQHGIEWVVTGDVYEAEFEKYRDEFNSATLAGIEAERGKGYMKKLSEDIEARMSRRYQSKNKLLSS